MQATLRSNDPRPCSSFMRPAVSHHLLTVACFRSQKHIDKQARPSKMNRFRYQTPELRALALAHLNRTGAVSKIVLASEDNAADMTLRYPLCEHFEKNFGRHR